MPMKTEIKDNKYWIDCGKVTREWRAECQEWCWRNWGPNWGDVDTRFDHTIFIFHRAEHASWFLLRWN